jgi:DNA-binding response OmpR family regulator
MTDNMPTIVLGDAAASARAALEPVCRELGWELVVVESSFQVLRMIRDRADIALVAISPDLPGAGVSGRDVARTIKVNSQYQSIPVVFVLHTGEAPPEGHPVDGVIEIDRWEPARLAAALRAAMAGDATPMVAPSPPGGLARGDDGVAAATAAAARPQTSAPPARPARILIAAATAEARGLIDPLARRQGWQPTYVQSGFHALRMARDAEFDLVLIDPGLQAAGVSGVDIARTIKTAGHGRRVPVLFVLAGGQAPPAGVTVDGAVDLDPARPGRLLNAINRGLGRPVEAVEDHVLAAELIPSGGTGAVADQGAADADSADPQPRPHAPPPASAGPGRVARAEALEDARAALEAVLREFVGGEARAAVEAAAAALAREVVPAIAERLVRAELARMPAVDAVVGEAIEQLRGQLPDELRRAAHDAAAREVGAVGRQVVEEIAREYAVTVGRELAAEQAGAVASATLPALVEAAVYEQLARTTRPGPDREELASAIRAEVEARVSRWLDEWVARQPAPPGPDAVDQAVRRYVSDAARDLVEDTVGTVAREVVPAAAARAVEAALAQIPSPAAAIEQALSEARARLEHEAGRAADALAREVVPAVVERLAAERMATAPDPAARLEETLGTIESRILEEARHAARDAAARYVETEGRATVEEVVRSFVTAEATSVVEAVARAAARDIVPAVAERLVREELASVPAPAARLEQALVELRDVMLVEAHRAAAGAATELCVAQGRSILEAAVREYLDAEGSRQGRELLAAAIAQIVPALAEGLLREQLARMPAPATKLEELMGSLRESLLADARHLLDESVRHLVAREAQPIVEAATREWAAVHRPSADDAVRAVAREVVPAVAERLISAEIARLRAEHGLA